MATTLTPNKNLSVIGITDTGWGPPTNANAEAIDKALGGAIGISAVSGTTVMTISDLQNMTLVFYGALGANAIYQVPVGVSGQWVVVNNTTGSYTLTIASQSGGTSVIIPQSTTGTVYVNSAVALGAIRADTPFTSASSDTQVIYNSSGNLIGSDTLNYSLSGGLSVGSEDATTNSVAPAVTLTRQSSGTPAVGIGISAVFNLESSAGRVIPVGRDAFVCTANGVGSESSDYVLSLMASGVFSEKVRVTSAGAMSAQTVTGNWVASSSEATTGTSSTKIMTPERTKEVIDRRFYTSPNQVITPNGKITLAHGLPNAPVVCGLKLVCVSADQGYSVGEVIAVSLNGSTDTVTRITTMEIDATNIVLHYSNTTNVFSIPNKTSGVIAGSNNSSWRAIVTAIG